MQSKEKVSLPKLKNTSKLQDISRSKKKYMKLGGREGVLHKEPLINAAYFLINAAYFLNAAGLWQHLFKHKPLSLLERASYLRHRLTLMPCTVPMSCAILDLPHLPPSAPHFIVQPKHGLTRL